MLKNNNNSELLLGIDGGGSKCKAIVMNKKNEVLGTGISGPGNPLHGFEQATYSITESAKLALADAGLAHVKLNELSAGVGLAGVNLPVLFNKMAAWRHPFKTIHLATDLLIACLGAHQGNEGAVIITGTGSCGFSYIDDQEFVIGAHGFPHGDKGSGAWFGLQAAKKVLLSIDGLAEPSLMNTMLLTRLACHDDTDLVEQITGKTATYFAQFANLVFDAAEQGDNLALSVIKEGADYINDMAQVLLARNPDKLSMIGGLAPRLTPWLAQDVQAQLSEALCPPEVGAILFAQRELTQI